MATQEQRDFMPGYFFTHDAIRNDLRRLRTFAKRSDASSDDYAAFERWLTKVHEPMIQTHHHTEDHIFIPRMLEIAPSFKEAADMITREHHELDARMTDLMAVLPKASSNPAAVSSAIIAYADVVDHHLNDEEPVVATSVMKALTKEQFLAIEKEHQKSGSMKDLALGIPWILESVSDADFQKMKKMAPAPMFYIFGALNLLFWKPNYQRLVKGLPRE